MPILGYGDGPDPIGCLCAILIPSSAVIREQGYHKFNATKLSERGDVHYPERG